MADTGFINPGTVVDDASVGTITWSNPQNAAVEDSSTAQADIASGTHTTHYLKATNFDFSSIPSGSVINGIQAQVRRSELNTGVNAKDASVRLVKGGTVQGDNKADTVTEWPTAGASVQYGGSTDLWGLTLSYSDVTASNFGIAFAGSGTNVIGVDLAVNAIWIKVFYTASLTLNVTGFQSSVTVGTEKLTLDMKPNGFQSTITEGTVTMRPVLDISPSGFQSTVATSSFVGLIDNFNRANEDPITGWTNFKPSAFATGAINSNTLVCGHGGANNDDAVLFYPTVYSPNQEVKITLTTLGANTKNFRIYLRVHDIIADTSAKVYAVRLTINTGGNDTLEVFKGDTDVELTTAILIGAADTSQNFVNGDTLGAKIVGNTISVYRNDILIFTRDDSTYSGISGQIGFRIKASPWAFDNAYAGNIETTRLELNFQPTGFQSTITEGMVKLPKQILLTGFQSLVTMGAAAFATGSIAVVSFETMVVMGDPSLAHANYIKVTGFQSSVTTGTIAIPQILSGIEGFQSVITTGIPITKWGLRPNGFQSLVFAGAERLIRDIAVSGFLSTVTTGTLGLRIPGQLVVTGFQSHVTTGLTRFEPIVSGFKSTVTMGHPIMRTGAAQDILPIGFKSVIVFGEDTLDPGANIITTTPSTWTLVADPPETEWEDI